MRGKKHLRILKLQCSRYVQRSFENNLRFIFKTMIPIQDSEVCDYCKINVMSFILPLDIRLI